MYLDGCFMLSEKNKDYYHDECIKLIPKGAKNILIIGGGDCAIAKLLSNQSSVKEIDIVEIDKQVVLLSQKYFPRHFNYKKNDKKKINLIIEDGYVFLKKRKKYNCIIVDSTDQLIRQKY